MSNGKKLLNKLLNGTKVKPLTAPGERDSEGLIVAIVKAGAHDNLKITPNEFVNMVRRLVGQGCLDAGINTHIGYDLNSLEDIVLYLNSLTRHIQIAKSEHEQLKAVIKVN